MTVGLAGAGADAGIVAVVGEHAVAGVDRQGDVADGIVAVVDRVGREVVALAGEGDGDVLGGGAAIAVVDLDLIGLDQGLALVEEVEVGVGRR